MTEIVEGDLLPEFSLLDENGDVIRGDMMRGLRWVLYFFPNIDTPGCTREALDFTQLYPTFMIMNVPIIGVSSNSPDKHKAFIKKHSLKVKMLCDENRLLQERLGVWVEKNVHGQRFMGTVRSTFVIGPDGRIESIWRNVKYEGHAATVLDRVRTLYKRKG